MTFHVGDVVTDVLAQPPEWLGVVTIVEVNRVAVSTKNNDILWYPISWLRHATMSDLSKKERPMEDTREYLQTVTGGA